MSSGFRKQSTNSGFCFGGLPSTSASDTATCFGFGKRTSASFEFAFGASTASANCAFGSQTLTGSARSGLIGQASQICENTGKEIVSKSPKTFQRNKVFQDLKRLFLEQENCDVILKIKEHEFKAHRIILAARSSVFGSTFRNDMQEKETGIVNIEDCDPSSFSDFLHFLYCGEVETLSEENVFSLFTTADKYDVQDLREMCLEFMKENISVGVFCDTLTFALQHSENELITVATDFFVQNARKIVKSVPWQTYLTNSPIQGNELVIKALDMCRCRSECE